MSYYLRAVCGSCGHRVRVSVEHAGRRAKCPKCQAIIVFPNSAQAYAGRTDTELTRDARAKAGEVEDVITTGQLLPEPLPSRVEGRGTTLRMRPVVHAPKRQTPLIIATLVGAVAALVGIGVLLFSPPERTASNAPEPPPTAPPRKPPPQAPPAPPPFEKERAEVSDRFTRFIKAYNENDVGKLAGFYEAEPRQVRQAFEEVFFRSTLKYEDWRVVRMDFEAGKAVLQFRFNRIRTTDGAKEELKDQEKTLTWIRKDDAWVISDKPEP